MVKVDVGPYNKEAHDCAQKPDCAKPAKSAFPSAPVVTGVTNAFATKNPEINELMSKMTFSNLQLNTVLAWKKDNNASAEETAVTFLQGNSDVWSKWLSPEAKVKLAALIK